MKSKARYLHPSWMAQTTLSPLYTPSSSSQESSRIIRVTKKDPTVGDKIWYLFFFSERVDGRSLPLDDKARGPTWPSKVGTRVKAAGGPSRDAVGPPRPPHAGKCEPHDGPIDHRSIFFLCFSKDAVRYKAGTRLQKCPGPANFLN